MFPIVSREKFIGLSTEAKPTASQLAGATFLEYDTGLLKIHNGVEWVIKADPEPFLYRIAEGKITGKERWFKIAHNPTLSTAAIISPNNLASYVWPAEGKQPVLASSSVEDDPDKGGEVAGTGIHAVTVTYLDEDYIERTEDVALNGTTEVTMVADDVLRINHITAKTVGSGGSAAGGIYIKDATGGNVIGWIAATNNCNRVGVYTVPAGKTLYVTDAKLSATHTAANKRAIIRLASRQGGIFRSVFETSIDNNVASFDFTMPLRFTEETDLFWRGVSDGTASINVFAGGWLE
jgi:hypothetical protein